QHAAFAAIALEKIGLRARQERPGRPTLALALHTELVRVGRHREGGTVDGDAKHAALGVLEALGSVVEPGPTVGSAPTAALLAPRFELVPISGGTGLGTGACRLVGARDVEHGLTAFVGREAELGLLRERLDQAKAGRGQLVSIVGEPGIGKSR